MLRFSSVVVVLVLFVVRTNTASHLASGPHMADVNILLPPKMTHPVEYRLQGSDGCFKWSWDHHDILSVLPEYNVSSYCSTSALLKSMAPYSGRKETAVYATDVNTGMVIRCKVYIDKFSRIQIFHNSIKLDLEGLATLRVRAFDDEDNVFSSLVGLQFMWQLMPETDGLSHHLDHVPLKDSPLGDGGGFSGDLNIQTRLEDNGVFSDLYVVKGRAIGHEIVSVHLLESQFEHMADKIVLTVAEAMSLEPPSPVFVLVGAVVHYSLKVIRGNIPQVVTLPSPFHRWSVSNSSVAQVDAILGMASAQNLGATTIIVEDTRVAGHTQMSTLYVVIPDTLYIYILPLSLSGDPVEGIKPILSGSRWYVVSGRQYLIHLKVFSRSPDAHEIYLAKSDDVELHDDKSEHWNTFSVSDSIAVEHGWWSSRILEATSYGLGKLTATLTYNSGHQGTKEVLKVMQEVMVCDQVTFCLDKRSNLSQSILLPWASAVYQEVELRATGGCAKASIDYKWFSSDMATVSVSASGIVQTKKPGKATIRVVSVFDSFNYDEVVIEVSIPSSMVMLPNFPVEVVVGSRLEASVTLKASNGAYFYRCDAFSSSVKWKTGSESFMIVNATREQFVVDDQEISDVDTSYGPPCAWTYVYASSSGRTILHATLARDFHHFDPSSSGPILLKASSRIAAYSPLIVHQVGDGNQFGGSYFDLAQAESHNQLENLDHLYLVPGTHLDVMLSGGPERWDQGVNFVENVETFDEEHTHHKDGVFVHQLSTNYGSAYRILCQKLGTFKLIFRRGNLVGNDHPLPAVAEVSLSLIGSFPSSIMLIADESVNAPEVIRIATKAGRSPGQIRTTTISVANGRTIRIAAVGISNSGKAFGNSSSLSLRWELSNCDGLAFWDDAYTSAITRSTWERFLVLHNASGPCTVRATVTEFIDTMSGYHSTAPSKSPESVLTDAIRLQLVSTLRVNPEFNLLFFSPDANLNLSITGGSCFLDTVVNDTQIVEVIQAPSGLQCEQLVLAPKGLGTALVTVSDIGLAPPLAASSVVQVADLNWIRINSPEEMSFMEGSLQSFNVSAGVDGGNTFDASQYIYMNIRVHIEDHIVELVDSYDFPYLIDGYIRAPNFIVRATHLGFTTLYVSATQQSGQEISSYRIKIEVYAPPRIHPSDIFLVPGASYMLTVRGGPTIGAYVEYASLDDETITIHNSTGRMSAIAPGNTTVVATVYGNRDIMICQAYGLVKVGVPSSVILNAQSEQLAVGREMPIYPSLSEGSLFSFYELCNNYKWTIEDEEVLNFKVAEPLRGDHHVVPFAISKVSRSTGYLDERNFGLIQVLYGKSAGKTDVTVSFSCEFASAGSFSQSLSYSASISLWVVPDLPLALGTPITWVLPPYYTTSNLLPSSSNLYSQGDAHSRKGTISYSLLRECGGKEAAQNDAIYIDGGKIKTMESNSLTCIQAKDKLTGRIEVASCVKVAEVVQIRITTEDFPMRTISLAVGTELEIPINYCDALGNPFHEAYGVIVFNAETNYPDIVSINDGSGNIHLKAIRNGRALVRISFSSNPQKSDYAVISVGAHLYPVNPVLHIGNRLHFSIEGVSDQVSGRWLSANGSVISVDMLSGKAEAIGEGTTKVIFEGSSLKLQTGVTVSKGNIVSVDAPKETLTNVPFPAKGYRFSVKFSDVYNHVYEGDGNGMVVLYDCRVDPPFVGYAKPWRDVDSANLYCLFFPYSPEHLTNSVPKSKDMRRVISVSMNASVRGDNHISGSASALFIGGFSVLEMDKNTLQLILTPESNKTVITIVGNTDIQVHWHYQDHLLIRPIYREDYGGGGPLQYEIKLVRAEKFKDKVILTLPATGQRVEVGVNYEPRERATTTTTTITHATFVAVVFGCFVMLILTVAVLICYLDRPDRSRQSILPATPSAPAPVTPDRSGTVVMNEQSPRTPQPFIDYVRRTIDETPYYRQDARRRFNSQNTF